MHSFNKISLCGVLETDPAFQTLLNGRPMGTFTLMTRRNRKLDSKIWEKRSEWHTIVVYRKDLLKILKDLKKGAQVSLNGRLSYEVWEKPRGVDQSFKHKKARVTLEDQDSTLTVYRPIREAPLRRLNNLLDQNRLSTPQS